MNTNKIDFKKLNAGQIASYDIKLDLKDEATGKSLYDIGNPYERVLKYRDDFSKLGMHFEADAAIRTMAIFSEVMLYVNNDGRIIELITCQETEDPYEYNKGKLKYQIGNVNDHEFVYRGDVMNSYIGTINAYKRKFGDELPEIAMNFLRFVHTIGNMTPVPFARRDEEFNCPRGYNNDKINDYWDLTLLAIYNWFRNKNGKSPIYALELIDVVKTEAAVTMCEKWLNNFKDENDNYSWDEFVKQNFMESFVEHENELPWEESIGAYGMPKELWDGHFETFENSPRPETKEQFIQFFDNAKRWVWLRGYKMGRTIVRNARKEKAIELGENTMMPGVTFEEYYEEISDENFTEEDRDYAKQLWDLLITITPFDDEERKVVEEDYWPNVDDVIFYSYDTKHMSEDVYDQLTEMLDFIYDDPLNGYLLDMIIDFYQ